MPKGAQELKDGWIYRQNVRTFPPLGFRMSYAAAISGTDGLMATKAYYRLRVEHYVLLAGGGYYSRMAVEVPVEWFNEPGPGWDSRKAYRAAKKEQGEGEGNVLANRHAPGYVLKCRVQLDRMLLQSNPLVIDEDILIGDLFLSKPEAFQGWTRPGFSWRGHTEKGKHLSVKAVAPRRIVIEGRWDAVVTPLEFWPFCYCTD
ncbi:MAG: hypothetical protein ACYTF6_14560, partial [Planctomycetota bacterium]